MQVATDDIKAFIKTFIQDELKVNADLEAPGVEQQSLFDDIGIDSIELLDLSSALQDRYKVNFKSLSKEQLMTSLASIESLTTFVEQSLGATKQS